ncbi:IS110 family transposase [Marivita hallyeonensis]|uniref:Transposase n=1 Tax=Marivita hallyeonensis TaxID=996342 RepID=A0A1M5W020_9RHOB|nr:IS110 family transposase [Marivita hallyeonensis]SHH80845.1 Transposase [Marivita hallyeonensis]
MSKLHILGVDLAKRTFAACGTCNKGCVIFRKKLTRSQFQKMLSDLPPCIVAMEACSSAHHWGRMARAAGHDVRLIPPLYVKPFVKRHKNDAIDAEAIAEAASRPSIRTVAVKDEDQQAQAVLFRTRELFVRQRTQLINAVRAHLAEYGIILPQQRRNGHAFASRCRTELDAAPSEVINIVHAYLRQIESVDTEVAAFDVKIKKGALRNGKARRMQTMPGIGPMTARAVQAFCPPTENFRKGQDFAAWLGLVPRQHSTGGKDRLGRITKMGQRDVRKLLIIGAMSVISASERKGHCDDPWLARMLMRRPRMLVAVALANRMARRLWAMLAEGCDYDIRAAA